MMRNRPAPMKKRFSLLRAVVVLSLSQVAAGGAHTALAQPASQSGAASGAELETVVQRSPELSAKIAAAPFAVGEKLEYDVRYLGGRVGKGIMEVREITNVRGRPAWHTMFSVEGRVLFVISVNITLESWFDVMSLNSLRFHQDQRYTGTKKIQHIEIYPERGMFKEDDRPELVTVADPLDDGSFLYFVRTIPLEVGQTYTFQRYYKPEKNPVKITVTRRETVTTPAGTFRTLVLQPDIKSGGLFGEGKSEVWVTDDTARMVVQMKSDLPVGTLTLYLTKIARGNKAKP